MPIKYYYFPQEYCSLVRIISIPKRITTIIKYFIRYIALHLPRRGEAWRAIASDVEVYYSKLHGSWRDRFGNTSDAMRVAIYLPSFPPHFYPLSSPGKDVTLDSQMNFSPFFQAYTL